MSNTEHFVRGYLDDLGAQLRAVDTTKAAAYVDLLAETWRLDRRVWVVGNGGSATTAAHHAVDLVKTAAVPGHRRLAAQAPAEIGMTTMVANDVGYADAFAYVLETYARPGDVLTALSCSGRSPSTVRACEWARANGLTVVALTGVWGGPVAALADLHVGVASTNYGIIEDVHLAVSHGVAQGLRARIERLVTAVAG